VRKKRASVSDLPVAESEASSPGSLFEATLADLVSAGREDSPAGRAALLLARRLDTPTADTGSSVAALVREHAARLEAAMRGVKVAGDPLDELKAARDRKRNAG
jgi:hypothetical protein